MHTEKRFILNEKLREFHSILLFNPEYRSQFQHTYNKQPAESLLGNKISNKWVQEKNKTVHIWSLLNSEFTTEVLPLAWLLTWLDSDVRAGGADRTGITDLTRTAGAAKFGFINLGLAEHTGTADFMVTGGAIVTDRGFGNPVFEPGEHRGSPFWGVKGTVTNGGGHLMGRPGGFINWGQWTPEI